MNVPAPLLQLHAVTKRFPGVTAVDSLDLELWPGRIHTLVGGNGSGKSTTVGMISGTLQPDTGRILLRGQDAKFQSPKHAKDQGIVTIFQERQVFSHLTVAENILLNKMATGFGARVNWESAFKQAQNLLDSFEVGINARHLASEYGVGVHQIIEIIRGITQNPAVLILDEPTASLSRKEVEMLFGFLRNLKANNVAILLIAHNLDEILEISDEITVLRDGQKVADQLDAKSTRKPDIIGHMLGPDVDVTMTRPAKEERLDQPLLACSDVPIRSWGTQVSLSLAEGEILSIVGLLGSGVDDLGAVLSGAQPGRTARIALRGVLQNYKDVRGAIRSGVGHLPADRKHAGLFMNLDVKANILGSVLTARRAPRLYRNSFVRELAQTYAQLTKVKPPNIHAQVANLSGGNQQKVLFSRLLALRSDVLLLENPTVGVDVGAQSEVHQLVLAQAAEGKGIILITSDFREAAVLSDRVLIMKNGEIADELTEHPFTEGQLLALAGNIETVGEVADGNV